MTRRLLPCLALTIFAVACTPTDPIDDVTSEIWQAELPEYNSMMLMTIAHRGTSLSGSGGFSQVLVPGSTKSYTITGMRRADTLDLVLKRPDESIHFVGSYSGGKRALTGYLTGGDFYGAQVYFIKK